MKAATVLRRTAAALLVFALVWCAVVLVWRARAISPSAGDIGLYLVALPLGLVGSYWLLRWGLDTRRAKQAATAEGAALAGTDGSEPAQVDHQLHVLASALLLRAGANADEVAQALVEPQRPSLHPTLKNDAGMPVFVASVEGLEPDPVADALRAVLADGADFEQLFAEEPQRALALLDPVAEELLLVALPPVDEAFDPYAAPKPRPAGRGVLRVRVLLPSAWPAPARQATADWLQAKATAIGYLADDIRVEALPVAQPGEVWRLLDHLAQAQARASLDDGVPADGAHDRHLLLAAHSLVGEHSIEQLGERRQLLGSGHPEGLVPGEGAAGVLLSGPVLAIDPDAPAPLRLHRVAHGASHADPHSRAAVRHASELLQRALALSAQAGDGIATVASDADHRPSRAVEIAGAVSAVLPELDPVQHCRHLGLACGELGAVAPVALLALAAAQCAHDAAPVLAMALADAHARAAFVVSPLPVAVEPLPFSPDQQAVAPAVPA
ncbi:hypothetical protein ACFQZQ_09745 [Lysobacter koreensis]|uniref:Transmembrane protein n=1 Tax=Lysobacter koreensis TaxID=266122 RepID=A0ABW2YMD3_9GAMM